MLWEQGRPELKWILETYKWGPTQKNPNLLQSFLHPQQILRLEEQVAKTQGIQDCFLLAKGILTLQEYVPIF